MFQAELILYLQSLASDGLTALMNTITSLGDDKVLAGILLLVALGISFRKGMLLLQVFMWTLMLTDGLKAFFNLPRPPFVNANIRNLQHSTASGSLFTNPGAETLLGPMDRQVVAAFRLQGDKEFGFPSGHVSSAAALWGGIALLFRKRILYWVAPILIILVALSRMYLGRHFLGDVLGGIGVAAAVLTIAYLFLDRWGFERKLFERANLEFAAKLPNALNYTLLLVGPLLLGILSPDVLGKGAGYLVGTNAAFVLIVMRGLDDGGDSLLKRAVRLLMGFGLYFGTYGIVDLMLEATGLEAVAFIDVFVTSAVLTFVSIFGAYSVSDRLPARV